MKSFKTENLNTPKIMLRQRVGYSFILFVAIVWCAGFMVAPLWAGKGGFQGEVSAFLYNFYSKNCHQEDSRSFHILGNELGVCSRCTMIYFGFLLSTIIYPFVKRLNNFQLPAVWILLAGAFFVGIDAGLDMFDIWKNTFLSREITGSILGLILPFFIIPGSLRLTEELFIPPKKFVKSINKQ